jgi:maltose O-acetyltransferase
VAGRGIKSNWKIGQKCQIAHTAILDSHGLVTIGDGATICHYAALLAHDASSRLTGRPRKDFVTVGAGSFIGVGAIVLDGVTVGANSVVGAGSVVTHDVPDNEVWAGNPARKIGDCIEIQKESSE